jgi:hypothetical protein
VAECQRGGRFTKTQRESFSLGLPHMAQKAAQSPHSTHKRHEPRENGPIPWAVPRRDHNNRPTKRPQNYRGTRRSGPDGPIGPLLEGRASGSGSLARDVRPRWWSITRWGETLVSAPP